MAKKMVARRRSSSRSCIDKGVPARSVRKKRKSISPHHMAEEALYRLARGNYRPSDRQWKHLFSCKECQQKLLKWEEQARLQEFMRRTQRTLICHGTR